MPLTVRFATIREVDIYYEWANDPLVRKNSYQSLEISYQQHVVWFNKKLLDKNCYLYYFEMEHISAGQVRIEIGKEETVIGISIDGRFRGHSLSSEMLNVATKDFLDKNPKEKIYAYIKKENENSYRSFLKAGFNDDQILTVSGSLSYKMFKTS
jgi:UDP-2,4-diacetamido-2,4,6-trideoxy-beta-L-altropyranose hydrolase